MPLDTDYIPSKYFQEYLVDKDTGCPLAGGIITFYKDQARTEKKPMYKITGSPPSYSYTALPNPLTLSAVGTFQDGGADIIPYFYPYDDSGNIELYYITVESSGNISQFTREGEPNISAREIDEEELQNYVPNGQFIIHTEFAEQHGIEQGEITQEITDVAQGGWTFERNSGTIGKDFIKFDRFSSITNDPNGFPRYACRVINEVPGSGDTIKGLRLKFRNVNKFASDSQEYTFSFVGKSNTAGESTVSINVIKNFGTGGSSATSTPIQDVILTTDYQIFNINIPFGLNDGKTLGALNDDFVQVEISFPVTFVFDDSFTNISLIEGKHELSEYPFRPTAQDIYKSLGGWLPSPDYENKNIYLPVILGPEGLEYDETVIGKIQMSELETAERGELLCHGQILETDQYSSDGIPYRRLYEKWMSNVGGLGNSLFGTGTNYMTLKGFGVGISDLYANAAGATTAMSDGTIPTGFTFTPIQPNPYIERITFLAGSSITAGAYFNYYTPVPEGNRHFICWYEVDGVGTQPTTSANRYRKISILSTDVANTVALKTEIGINSFSYTVIDLRGYLVRGWADGVGTDPDRAARLDRGDGTTGDHPGTIQPWQIQSHTHPAHSHGSSNSSGNPGLYGDYPATTDWNWTVNKTVVTNTKRSSFEITPAAGGNQTNGINKYVTFVVKY